MDVQHGEHGLDPPSPPRLWQWKRVSDITTIRSIVQLLGRSHSPTEQDLRKQITQALLSDTHSHGKLTSSASGGKDKNYKGSDPATTSSSSSSSSSGGGGGVKGEEEGAAGLTVKNDPYNTVRCQSYHQIISLATYLLVPFINIHPFLPSTLSYYLLFPTIDPTLTSTLLYHLPLSLAPCPHYPYSLPVVNPIPQVPPIH